MLGAIIGDIIGSRFERYNYKGKDFKLIHESCKMTDDSVLTIAVADAFINKKDYAQTIKEYGRENPLAGYGGSFIAWLDSPESKPYNSWGNGSAMRVSALAWLIDDESVLMEEAKKSAECTHNHPEGIKGAQAIAAAILLARKGSSKGEIKAHIESYFKYDLNRTVKSLVETYEFDVSCQGSVPEAIICFLESTGFEDCIRTAISIGGDSDTIASMSGAIAEAFYNEIPNEMMDLLNLKIEENQKYKKVLYDFLQKSFENRMLDSQTKNNMYLVINHNASKHADKYKLFEDEKEASDYFNNDLGYKKHCMFAIPLDLRVGMLNCLDAGESCNIGIINLEVKK